MRRFFVLVMAAMALLTSCGNAALPEVSEESSAVVSDISEPSNSESDAAVSEVSEASQPEAESSDVSEEEGTEITGGITMCPTHTFTYHSIESTLISHVGPDNFNAWINSLGQEYNDWHFDETGSIVEFVEYFQIPKDTFISLTRDGVDEEFIEEHDGITMYSMEQIDAIYSGDPKEVNRVFCGPLAVYNENDGQLYSLHWITDHTAEECVAAGLPLDEVQEIVETAQTDDYWHWYLKGLDEEAEATLEQAEAIEASLDAAE